MSAAKHEQHNALFAELHAPVGRPSARVPYKAPMSRWWFLRTREYRLYALREFSSVVVGFFVVDLVTALAVAMSLVHATTWFEATPKIIKIRRGPRYVADGWVVALHYVLLVAFAALMYFWLGGL